MSGLLQYGEEPEEQVGAVGLVAMTGYIAVRKWRRCILIWIVTWIDIRDLRVKRALHCLAGCGRKMHQREGRQNTATQEEGTPDNAPICIPIMAALDWACRQ